MKKLLTLLLTLILGVVACVSMVGCGAKTYKDLSIVEIGAKTESFGIAFRKGSDVTLKVETAIKELQQAGKLAELAKTYGVAGVDNFTPKASENADSSDWATISANGKLVVGITDYKPMDYKEDGSDKWIGFDADLATLVCEKLGVAVEFKEIEWSDKLLDLQAGRIDCIWNGMTITDEVKLGADCTAPYMENRQVAVVLTSKKDALSTLSAMEGKKITAESGSAGENLIKASEALSKNYVAVTSQSDAFLEVMSGKSDVAIVDYMMARALIEG